MAITYDQHRPEIDDIIAIYQSSGIRRPVQDANRIREMYRHANLVITAWDGEKPVGIARALTDFSYCCYLSDLAVRAEYQHQGIGKRLIGEVKQRRSANKACCSCFPPPLPWVITRKSVCRPCPTAL